MKKNILKELLLESYSNGDLDAEKVENIANHLKRGQLKEYIRVLKASEKKKSIIFTSPTMPSEEAQKKLQDMFLHKKIVYVIDPDLLMGIKVTNEDMEYDLNLQHTLDTLLEYIEHSYEQ